MKSATNAESVLVVDDDLAIRRVLQEILSREGYDVRVAENGAQALDTMRADRPDVVVLDLMMPVLSGWEVLAITDEDETLRTIPILVASAMGAPVADPGRRGGVRMCLSKPLDIPALLEALRRVTLPATPCPPAGPSAAASPSTAKGRELRALLVEGSADDAALIQSALRHSGYPVVARRVTSQREYVAALDAESWDLVISDFSLPGFDGRAALEILKARGIDLPFIVVSGPVGEDVAVEMMRAGAHDFFSKGRLSRLGPAVDREVREAARRKAEGSERRRVTTELEQLLCDLRGAVKVRDDFLSIASHELKTPLTALQLEVQLLQRLLARDGPAALASSLEGRLGIVARQVTRLTSLINSLLDVARLSGGQNDLHREVVDLKDVVTDVLTKSAEVIQHSGSEVTTHASHVVGQWDRGRILSLVSNLLLNAVKYGEGRPIEVDLGLYEGHARLVVKDQGIGIAKSEQCRIFEKFERAVPMENFGGFGVGLWIARQAAVAHGGQIVCQSLPGAGSTFTVDLPLSAQGAA